MTYILGWFYYISKVTYLWTVPAESSSPKVFKKNFRGVSSSSSPVQEWRIIM